MGIGPHSSFKFLSPIYFELYCDVIRPRLLTVLSAMLERVVRLLTLPESVVIPYVKVNVSVNRKLI